MENGAAGTEAELQARAQRRAIVGSLQKNHGLPIATGSNAPYIEASRLRSETRMANGERIASGAGEMFPVVSTQEAA